MIEARGVHFHYGDGTRALDGLDLAVHPGRKLAILGPNGAGKTTLLLHLNGTLWPHAGGVFLDGAPGRYDQASLAAWRRRVALVLQDPDDQLFAATVAEDVGFGPANAGLPPVEVAQRVAETLRHLQIEDLAERPPHALSFGQKKRAALAGALAMHPEMLLLDEPTAGLDEAGAAHLLAALQTQVEAGMGLVFTTHDAELALAFADEVALFQAGRVLAHGAPEVVLGDTALLAAAGLRPPLVLAAAQAARRAGLLADGVPLPRDRDGLIALIEGLAR